MPTSHHSPARAASRDTHADQDHQSQEVAVNLYTTDRAVVLVAPMPGITADDLHVELRGRDLTVSSDLRTPADKDYVIREFDYGCYRRTVELPVPVAGEPTVSLGNGLLAVTVPRAGVAQVT